MTVPIDIVLPDDPPNTGPLPLEERRNPDAPVTRSDLSELRRQLATDGLRMTAIESELRINTAVTAEVRALLEAGKTGMKVLGWIGNAAQWAAKIAGAVVAVYAAYQLYKNGKAP